MPNFAEKVELAVEGLSANPPRDIDENDFIEASRLVYDGVRDIRQAVLMNRVGVFLSQSLIQEPGTNSDTVLLMVKRELIYS